MCPSSSLVWTCCLLISIMTIPTFALWFAHSRAPVNMVPGPAEAGNASYLVRGLPPSPPLATVAWNRATAARTGLTHGSSYCYNGIQGYIPSNDAILRLSSLHSGIPPLCPGCDTSSTVIYDRCRIPKCSNMSNTLQQCRCKAGVRELNTRTTAIATAMDTGNASELPTDLPWNGKPMVSILPGNARPSRYKHCDHTPPKSEDTTGPSHGNDTMTRETWVTPCHHTITDHAPLPTYAIWAHTILGAILFSSRSCDLGASPRPLIAVVFGHPGTE